MKFDLEPGKEIQTLLGKAPQRVPQNLPRRERHRLAVGENNIAEQPPGMRRPGQNLERCRVGDHDEIAATLHFCHVETAAGGEHRVDGLVCSILGEERCRHGDAAGHCAERVGRHQGFAAQHAVLVGKRKANQFELIALDLLRDRLGEPRLFVGPEAVTLDKSFGSWSLARGHAATLSARWPSFSFPAGSCWCSANSLASRRRGQCRRRRPGR